MVPSLQATRNGKALLQSARSRSVSTSADGDSDASSTGDDSMMEVATHLQRTPFAKKATFGRWSEVYLEWHDDLLLEYRTSTAGRPHKIYNLGSEGAKLLDAHDLTNQLYTFAVFSTKGSTADRTRAFFKSSDPAMFELWFRSMNHSMKKRASYESSGAPAAALFSDPTLICDYSGIVIDCNDAVCKLLGWTHDNLVGKSNKILMPEALRQRHDQVSALLPVFSWLG